MLAVYKKELKQYFTSMLGFVFIAFFLIIVGLYFMIYCLMNQMANFSYVMSGIQFLFVLSVPILTMKIIPAFLWRCAGGAESPLCPGYGRSPLLRRG